MKFMEIDENPHRYSFTQISHNVNLSNLFCAVLLKVGFGCNIRWNSARFALAPSREKVLGLV